jgi:hypothetical protein
MLDFQGFDTVPFVVGQDVLLVEYSSHLGVGLGFATWMGVVVANTVVGPTEG